MRADARRNYDRLLAEARETFDAHGADAPLEDIARRAGVGIGTLYRHFPTRQALYEAVYRDRIEELSAEAYDLVAAYEPEEALRRWIRSMLRHAASKRGLNAALSAAIGKDSELFAQCRDTVFAAASTLLIKAQEAGVVRRDIEVPDLMKLVHAIALVSEESPDAGDRMIGLVLDGLRSR